MGDQEVDLRPAPEHPENDLGGKAGVAGVETFGKIQQQIGCVSPALDLE